MGIRSRHLAQFRIGRLAVPEAFLGFPVVPASVRVAVSHLGHELPGQSPPQFIAATLQVVIRLPLGQFAACQVAEALVWCAPSSEVTAEPEGEEARWPASEAFFSSSLSAFVR